MTPFDELKAAAERREPLARIKLAEHYAHGLGTQKNIELAYSLLEQAANDGESSAAAYLALIYAEGLWGNKDPEKARYWTVLAAQGGDTDALVEMGNEMEKRAVHDHQRLQALEYYERAAAAGNPFAALRLYMAYSFGDLGNEIDQKKAKHYFELEAQLRVKMLEQMGPLSKNQ
jgi:TPR repeat protein